MCQTTLDFLRGLQKIMQIKIVKFAATDAAKY